VDESCHVTHVHKSCHMAIGHGSRRIDLRRSMNKIDNTKIFLNDGYCSIVQGLLDWFEVNLGFTERLFIQIDLCVDNTQISLNMEAGRAN